MHRLSALAVVVVMCAAMTLYFLIAALDRPALSTRTTLDSFVPLVPSAIFFYLSIYVAGPLFALGIDGRTMRRAIPRMLAILVCLFAVFLAVPTVVERPVADGETISIALLQWVYRIDHTARNAAPSGHAALAVFLGWLFFAIADAEPSTWRHRARPAVALYVALVVVSVVLTKQHHVVDMVSGVALAVVVLVSGRWVDRLRGFRARSRQR